MNDTQPQLEKRPDAPMTEKRPRGATATDTTTEQGAHPHDARA